MKKTVFLPFGIRRSFSYIHNATKCDCQVAVGLTKSSKSPDNEDFRENRRFSTREAYTNTPSGESGGRKIRNKIRRNPQGFQPQIRKAAQFITKLRHSLKIYYTQKSDFSVSQNLLSQDQFMPLRVSDILCLSTFTSLIFTSITSPTEKSSEGCLMYLSDISEMWRRPSW